MITEIYHKSLFAVSRQPGFWNMTPFACVRPLAPCTKGTDVLQRNKKVRMLNSGVVRCLRPTVVKQTGRVRIPV
jgi:hypothetical protein